MITPIRFTILTFLIQLFLLASSGKETNQQTSWRSRAERKVEVIQETSYEAPVTTIRISNQQEFDRIQTHLDKSIRDGYETIIIDLSPGIYVYKHNHLTLSKIKKPSISIKILGHNTRLIADGQIIRNGEKLKSGFDNKYSFLNERYESLSEWSKTYQTDELIEVIEPNTKTCRIHIPNILPSQVGRYSLISITESFESFSYKIQKIEGEYVYFYAHNLQKYLNNYNVNCDWVVGGTYPRFRLCNVDNVGCPFVVDDNNHLYSSLSSVRVCRAGTFFYLNDSCIKGALISGISFMGNNMDCSVINLSNSNILGTCFIKGCSFESLKGLAIAIKDVNNVRVSSCRFKNLYKSAIKSENTSVRTQVDNCDFYNIGVGLTQSFAIVCRGKDFLIRDNRITNFCYGAIGAGVWYKDSHPNLCTGIIENNIVSYSNNDPHFGRINTLMDSGAIYLWTILDDVIVRYNRISNCTGMYGNSGIYCDDGAKNFILYSNVITGVSSWCIYSRRTRILELYDSSQYANINNYVYNNIIDGSLKFEGNETKKNTCFMGNNCFIVKDMSQNHNQIIKDVEETDPSKKVLCKGYKNERIRLARSSKRTIKQQSSYKAIKHFFR